MGQLGTRSTTENIVVKKKFCSITLLYHKSSTNVKEKFVWSYEIAHQFSYYEKVRNSRTNDQFSYMRKVVVVRIDDQFRNIRGSRCRAVRTAQG